MPRQSQAPPEPGLQTPAFRRTPKGQTSSPPGTAASTIQFTWIISPGTAVADRGDGERLRRRCAGQRSPSAPPLTRENIAPGVLDHVPMASRAAARRRDQHTQRWGGADRSRGGTSAASVDGSSATASQLGPAPSHSERRRAASRRARIGVGFIMTNRTGGEPASKERPLTYDNSGAGSADIPRIDGRGLGGREWRITFPEVERAVEPGECEQVGELRPR